MKNLIADIQLYDKDSLHGIGSYGLSVGSPSDAASIFNNIISTTIGLMTIVAIIWFIFLLISGAIGIMTSGGDKAGAEGAKKRITNGIIGLVIVIAAIFIIKLMGLILGIPNILDPTTFLEEIWMKI